MKKLLLVALPLAIVVLALAGWGAWRLTARGSDTPATTIPTTRVKRGDVTITVTARGDLQGGNSEMLTAPMVAGDSMAITSLRRPGELVQAGEVVVEFDTTEQEFNLKEAEADLAEAEQQVAKAQASNQARDEETRLEIERAEADIKVAELDCRKNPIEPAIKAQQNTLALESARDRLRQLKEDLANSKAAMLAGVAIQEAARSKAKVKADTARKNIEMMTLRAKMSGYVNIQQNTNANFYMSGMQLPIFQRGDMVRPGMGVAQIPDLKSWEASARIGELDRGQLAPGQKTEVRVIALSERGFRGRVKDMGAVTGPPWDRRFDCKITLDELSPELRPGMSVIVVVTAALLKNVLWVPSQALFESDGRTFVYVQSPTGFVPKDVKMTRRSESQVVLEGLAEGQVVALSSPDQETRKAAPAGGAMKALGK